MARRVALSGGDSRGHPCFWIGVAAECFRAGVGPAFAAASPEFAFPYHSPPCSPAASLTSKYPSFPGLVLSLASSFVWMAQDSAALDGGFFDASAAACKAVYEPPEITPRVEGHGWTLRFPASAQCDTPITRYRTGVPL